MRAIVTEREENNTKWNKIHEKTLQTSIMEKEESEIEIEAKAEQKYVAGSHRREHAKFGIKSEEEDQSSPTRIPS